MTCTLIEAFVLALNMCHAAASKERVHSYHSMFFTHTHTHTNTLYNREKRHIYKENFSNLHTVLLLYVTGVHKLISSTDVFYTTSITWQQEPYRAAAWLLSGCHSSGFYLVIARSVALISKAHTLSRCLNSPACFRPGMHN